MIYHVVGRCYIMQFLHISMPVRWTTPQKCSAARDKCPARFHHNVLEAVDWLDVTGDGGVKSLMIDNRGFLESLPTEKQREPSRVVGDPIHGTCLRKSNERQLLKSTST